jgi:hypothetical protein
MNPTHDEIQRTITPLQLIFWGGLLCIFDITFSVGGPHGGLKFDIINDFVGMLMITSGVYQLGKIKVHDRYHNAMVFVTVIAILSCIDAFQEHFIYQGPPFLSFLLSVLAALAMAATVVFCVAMRWLCSEAGLEKSEQSWRTSTVLFAVIYLIPLGIFYSATAIAIVTETSFSIDLPIFRKQCKVAFPILF